MDILQLHDECKRLWYDYQLMPARWFALDVLYSLKMGAGRLCPSQRDTFYGFCCMVVRYTDCYDATTAHIKGVGLPAYRYSWTIPRRDDRLTLRKNRRQRPTEKPDRYAIREIV